MLLERALRALLLDERRAAHRRASPRRRSQRIWKAQHFSWWMTSMLHVAPGRHGLRPPAPARRAALGRRVRGRSHLPRRGVHGLAAPGLDQRPAPPVSGSPMRSSAATMRSQKRVVVQFDRGMCVTVRGPGNRKSVTVMPSVRLPPSSTSIGTGTVRTIVGSMTRATATGSCTGGAVESLCGEVGLREEHEQFGHERRGRGAEID